MIQSLLNRLFHRQSSWYERHFVWLLVLGVGVAMGISLAIGLMQSVWFDEAYSILLAKQPVAELLRLTSLDTHPPFYYLLLKLWAGIFGWSELALRSLSVVTMGGALTVGVLFVKRLFGVRAALLALLFAGLAPFLLRYGFEIRMYSLASLIGIVATYVLVRAVDEKDSRRQWCLYGLYASMVALGMYTMYYTALLWIVHVIWLVWLTKRHNQPVFKQRWWLAYAGSVLLFSPWLPTFIGQLTNGALAPIAQQMTAENMVGIVSFSTLYLPASKLMGPQALIILGVIVALAYTGTKAFQAVSKKQKPYLVLLSLYTLIPILLIAIISLVRPLYVERYLSHVLIGALLFMAVAMLLTVQRLTVLKWILPGGMVVVFLFGITSLAYSGNFNFQRLEQPSIKTAAAVVPCEKESIILASDPYTAIELSYYLPNCDIHFYSPWPTQSGGYAPLSGSPLQIKDPQRQLNAAKKVVLIGGEPSFQFPDGFVRTVTQKFREVNVISFEKQ